MVGQKQFPLTELNFESTFVQQCIPYSIEIFTFIYFYEWNKDHCLPVYHDLQMILTYHNKGLFSQSRNIPPFPPSEFPIYQEYEVSADSVAFSGCTFRCRFNFPSIRVIRDFLRRYRELLKRALYKKIVSKSLIMVCDSVCLCVCPPEIIRSVYPPHGQWPAPMGSWRVDYYG